MKAIIHPDIWAGIRGQPYAYANSIIMTKDQNWNEREAVKIHEKLKHMPAVDLEKLTCGLFKGFENAS